METRAKLPDVLHMSHTFHHSIDFWEEIEIAFLFLCQM